MVGAGVRLTLLLQLLAPFAIVSLALKVVLSSRFFLLGNHVGRLLLVLAPYSSMLDILVPVGRFLAMGVLVLDGVLGLPQSLAMVVIGVWVTVFLLNTRLDHLFD